MSRATYLYSIKFIEPFDFDWEVTLECVDKDMYTDPFITQHPELRMRHRSIDAYNEFGRRVHYTSKGIDLSDTVCVDFEVDANGLILAEKWFTLSADGQRLPFPL